MEYVASASKSMSSAKKAAIICTGLFVLVVGLTVCYPVKSVLWHCYHLSHLHLDGGKLTLPILWWRDSGSGNTEIVIRHAKFASVSDGKLTVFPLASEKIKVNEQAAYTWQQAFRASLSPEQRNTYVPVEVNTQETRIYCVKDIAFTDQPHLICRVPKMQWGIAFLGSAAEEQQAETIIASFQVHE